MNDKTKAGLEILEAAILLGVLGDVLLRETPWGLNIFLWILVLVAAMVALTFRRRKEIWNTQTILLHSALVFFAAAFVWRASIELLLLNGLAIFTILAILTLPALKLRAQLAGVSHYIIGFIWSGLNAAFAPIAVVFGDIKWKAIPQKGWSKHAFAVLRGLVIVTPLLIIFGGLFMAADAAFEGIIQRTFNIKPETILWHIFFVGFFSWIVAGYLRGSLFGTILPEAIVPVKTAPPLSITEPVETDNEKAEPPTQKWDWRNFDSKILPSVLTLGTIEISIVFGLMNLLFLSFVIVQLPYLFGGMELVQSTANLKLADYARRGFGELVFVSALVLPILLAGHWFLRRDNLRNEILFRVLAGIQIALLFVIMISAGQRMLLYTGNMGYGLTSARFFPMVFMILLAAIFIWFGATVLRGARPRFAWGALWLSLLTLGTLNVLNPEDFIVRTNYKLMQQGRTYDNNYQWGMSDDAMPALLETIPTLNDRERCYAENMILSKLTDHRVKKDVRTWNYSRWSATRKLEQYAANFGEGGNPLAYKECYKLYPSVNSAINTTRESVND